VYTTIDEFTGLLIPFPVTCYQLDGGQSLAYVRSRSPEYFIDGRCQDGGGIPDLDRIGRQQEFLRTLGRITIERATDDPRIAPDLADSVIPNLQADEGFDRAAFNALGRAFMGLGTGDESGIQFATLPTEGARRGGQDVLLSEQPGADEMLAVLRGDVVPDAVADDASATDDAAPVGVRPSEIRVSVRNGSGVAGAAGTALNDLSNRGFVSGVAANDERGTVARSEVRHRAGEEAKANLVASYVRGGVDLVVDNALGGDVVLVVGKSFTGIADAPSSPAKGAPAAPDTTLSPKDACR
jgi:hypothetical protein